MVDRGIGALGQMYMTLALTFAAGFLCGFIVLAIFVVGARSDEVR